MLGPGARLLAAADVYHAMTEPRPHREAHSPEQAAQLSAPKLASADWVPTPSWRYSRCRATGPRESSGLQD